MDEMYVKGFRIELNRSIRQVEDAREFKEVPECKVSITEEKLRHAKRKRIGQRGSEASRGEIGEFGVSCGV